MEKNILKKIQTNNIYDLTRSSNGVDAYIAKVIQSGSNIISFIDYIYLLKKLSSSIYQVSDHVNLSGFNPLKGPQFIQLNNIYIQKNKYPKITVAGLKKGIQPTEKEKEKLLSAGITAFCYHLVPAAIFAASKGLKINAIGIVK